MSTKKPAVDRLLVLFLGVSLVVNVVLYVQLYHPRQWDALLNSLVRAPVVRPSDHVRGAADAPVTVIEYSDFQCPYCMVLHQSLRSLVEEGEVRWVYRHYPLVTIHPQAHLAAEASECAAESGKFWDYSDEVFERQREISREELIEVATVVGLDPGPFEECLGSGRHSEKVSQQLSEGNSKRVRGTPTFWVNGKRMEGGYSAEQLLALIERKD
jgi:protein-disulfide isomerase